MNALKDSILPFYRLTIGFLIACSLSFPAVSQNYRYIVTFDEGSIPSDDSKGTWQACGDKKGGCDCGIGSSVRYVDSPSRRPGGKAVRIRLLHCHERTELSMNRKNRDPLGQELWLGWSVFIPADFKDMDDTGPRRWDYINQIHHGGSCHGPGHSAIEIRNHRVRLKLKIPGKSFSLGHIDKFKGHWNDFVAHYKWNSNGFFKLWLNAGPNPGDPIVDFKGGTWKCSGTGPYFKIGFYKGNPDWTEPEPRIMFVDEVRQATNASYKDVYPGLPNESTPVLNYGRLRIAGVNRSEQMKSIRAVDIQGHVIPGGSTRSGMERMGVYISRNLSRDRDNMPRIIINGQGVR